MFKVLLLPQCPHVVVCPLLQTLGLETWRQILECAPMAHRPSPKIGYGNQEPQLSHKMQQENNLYSKIQRGGTVLALSRNGRGDVLVISEGKK